MLSEMVSTLSYVDFFLSVLVLCLTKNGSDSVTLKYTLQLN